jgi:hypothetical protein
MLNLPLSFFLLFILHTVAACGGEDSFNKLFLKDLNPTMKKYVILAYCTDHFVLSSFLAKITPYGTFLWFSRIKLTVEGS